MSFEPSAAADPALSIALALAAGVLAQALARHLRLPGIVLLLGTGVLLGPEGLAIVRPASLGSTLQMLVGFAVAVILFEGGLNLNLTRLRREARSIRQLVTVGALVTAVGGTLCARLFLEWDWTRSILFGTLVIVTGPTVITPLLRRIRLKRSIATVLEAEGVLIDPIGAVIAVVTLEVLISPLGGEPSGAAGSLFLRLGFGVVAGLVGGALIALLLRFEAAVPEGLENVVTLSLVLALFQASNAFQHESGIVTVTVAGVLVGNIETRVLADLREFKEQLTVLLIGMLFVLLAADVRLEQVRSLGWPGVWTVAALMLLVRPLNVLVGTAGSDLKVREKAFLAWLAPRGIVAAAISSLFAQELERAGIAGGAELRALVFLVIAGTVLIQGLTGGPVARWLGVSRPGNQGWALIGANPLGLALGKALRQGGEEVVFLDANADACTAAERAGFRVLFGNALSERLLQRAEMDSRIGAIAVTANDEVNFLTARRIRDEFKLTSAWVALHAVDHRVTAEMLHKTGARLLFGEPRNVGLWIARLARGRAATQVWVRRERVAKTSERAVGGPRDLDNVLLPLTLERGGAPAPYEGTQTARPGDLLRVLVAAERGDEAAAWLTQLGWEREEEEEKKERENENEEEKEAAG